MSPEIVSNGIPRIATNQTRQSEMDGLSISEAEYSRMIDLYAKINRAYRRFFPEVYVDPKIQKLDIYRRGKFANGGFSGQGRTLQIDLGSQEGGADLMRLNANYDARDARYVMEVPERVGEIIVMSHEIAHGIFVQTVNPDTHMYKVDSNGKRESLPMEEGFATVLGTLFIEQAIAYPEALGISSAERDILIQHYAMRQYSNAKDTAPWAYKDGLKIIGDIYQDAGYQVAEVGDPGLLRVKEVLKGVKPNQVLSMQQEQERNAKYERLIGIEDPAGATLRWKTFVESV